MADDLTKLEASAMQNVIKLTKENNTMNINMKAVSKHNKALQARIKDLEAQQVCRPEVLAFATEMERVLKTNDYKGGWKHCDLTYLKRRLTQERGEFERALARYRADPEHEQSKQAVLDEACDIANFLMMTCDVIGALTPPTKEGGKE